MEFVSLLIFKLKGDEINNPIIQIRAATLNDVPGIARVHVDVWNSTYTGIVPQEFLDSRTYENKTPQWQRIVGEAKPRSHVYVAVTETDEVVGFTSGGVNRDETYKFDSELYAIYLLKNHHSKGIGRRLFELTINLLVADGFKNMLVWVLEENATREFYKKMGGTACGEKIEDIGGKPVPTKYSVRHRIPS